METEFLTGTKIEKALEDLMAEHAEYHWAVAWGTCGAALAGELQSNREKIRKVTFGLAFALTDPDLVDSLKDVGGCRVVTSPPGRTFHPKVYAFRSGDRAAAVVGSANFTRGGLHVNDEACVLVKGTTKDRMLQDALSFAGKSFEKGVPVTEELARRYRIGWVRAKRTPDPPTNPLGGVTPAVLKSLSSPLVSMKWEQYVRKVRGKSTHYDKRMAVLRTARAWLSAARSFGDLETPYRKAIAGTIGRVEQEASRDPDLKLEWGWFGRMTSTGYFMNRVAENDPHLASAVDSIPMTGEVTRDHCEEFFRRFVKAFENLSRVGDYPPASRLLAMKRPDAFFCVTWDNKYAAADGMGFARTTLKRRNYWDKIVEPIRASEWYNVDKPDGADEQLWEFRAAMLDAIYYRPR